MYKFRFSSSVPQKAQDLAEIKEMRTGKNLPMSLTPPFLEWVSWGACLSLLDSEMEILYTLWKCEK